MGGNEETAELTKERHRGIEEKVNFSGYTEEIKTCIPGNGDYLFIIG